MASYDAVVVGSGPNGLAAAITLQRAGLRVLLLEAKSTAGGGTRSASLTLPGYLHDVCSAIHPMAVASPFFRSLPLREHGLEFIQPPVALAHPLDGGGAAALHGSVSETAKSLGDDAHAYEALIGPLVDSWPRIEADVLGPLSAPRHPFDLARFAWNALRPASRLVGRFSSNEARGLFAGLAAHSFEPLTSSLTAAIGLVLAVAGHRVGWPIPKGGSQSIANALLSCFLTLGGTFETNRTIQSLDQIPSSGVILFDVTPRQFVQIAGSRMTPLYRTQLQRYRYGMGAFKIDWALDGPVPFLAAVCREAGTVHLGGTYEDIRNSEAEIAAGRNPERPFVLFAQQSRFDGSRAPLGKETAWAYCHVPHGSTADRTTAIEEQVERFAPGFRSHILARHTMDCVALESYNPNNVGGNINGGAIIPSQLFTRPALRTSPYRTSIKGIYLCSSSTPPGGGVHGMCGYHAAQRALKDLG